MNVGIARAALKLQKLAKLNLSGVVLNVRTGRLRRSINLRLDGKGTPNPSASVGTNVAYARVHEFGFEGTVNVRESLRMQVKAWGRPIAPIKVAVRAHARSVKLPERSFLKNALDALHESGEFEATMQQAINEKFGRR